MITKNKIKLIKSLANKKNRIKYQCFVVEGRKNIAELLHSDYEINELFANKSWIFDNPDIDAQEVSDSELYRISNYQNPNDVIAIVKIKEEFLLNTDGVVLVLDGINNPGNMGTIIRTCEWFGVKSLVCSHDTVDIYNPKVVQSSMGSVFRMNFIYTDLLDYLQNVNTIIYGSFITGNNVREISFPDSFHLLIGNESNGISSDLDDLINHKISVKSIGNKVESLNVAVATSILLYEINS